MLFEDFRKFIEVSPVYEITDKWMKRLLSYLGLHSMNEEEILFGSDCFLERVISQQSNNFSTPLSKSKIREVFYKLPDCLILYSPAN